MGGLKKIGIFFIFAAVFQTQHAFGFYGLARLVKGPHSPTPAEPSYTTTTEAQRLAHELFQKRKDLANKLAKALGSTSESEKAVDEIRKTFNPEILTKRKEWWESTFKKFEEKVKKSSPWSTSKDFDETLHAFDKNLLTPAWIDEQIRKIKEEVGKKDGEGKTTEEKIEMIKDLVKALSEDGLKGFVKTFPEVKRGEKLIAPAGERVELDKLSKALDLGSPSEKPLLRRALVSLGAQVYPLDPLHITDTFGGGPGGPGIITAPGFLPQSPSVFNKDEKKAIENKGGGGGAYPPKFPKPPPQFPQIQIPSGSVSPPPQPSPYVPLPLNLPPPLPPMPIPGVGGLDFTPIVQALAQIIQLSQNNNSDFKNQKQLLDFLLQKNNQPPKQRLTLRSFGQRPIAGRALGSPTRVTRTPYRPEERTNPRPQRQRPPSGRQRGSLAP